ncbi:type IV pilus modification protein PilV [Sinimarinibacterium sp. NLF-5-8]|uniref:type IV pilus modification protein PilV n=1 Tax=Sinimarinibacterium sp. NLF-5-8 TaxID=2698684 RepID=UPI00137BB948|nr:type IV pilus modification protein PilV [Sinimarinibacterium sp. NLF-5-8]QHS09188.1 type IV pilus modification protein PilV [Sinimarinibacterium sp. NLF-5-8]
MLKPHAQGGTSLLEVLIAVVLTSGAIMAATLLYGNALKFSKMAQSQGIAADIAVEIADRMRANLPGNYQYTQNYSATSPTESVPACANSNCTAAEMAARDLAEVRNRARQALPGGFIRITNDGNARNIWVMWTDPDDDKDGATKTCTGAGANANARCIALRVAL